MAIDNDQAWPPVTVYTGRHVLVTGSTGFIGHHLIMELLRRGAQVRALVRSSNTISYSCTGVDMCYGDLQDSTSLIHCCRGIETIFHAAGLAHAWVDNSPHFNTMQWQINAEGTRRLLEAALQTGVARFVFLSSVKAMGDGVKRCIDEAWSAPPSTPYGKAKRAAERWVLDAGREHGMHVVNLRLALVYGPGNKGNLERLVNAIRQGFFPPLPEVNNKRSMVHVADVVQAALIAANHPNANQKIYIVTDGQPYSSREIYDLICRGLGKEIPRWTVPLGILKALARVGDLMGRILGRGIGFDSEALEKLLGWACYRSDRIRHELGYRPSRSLAQALPEILRKN